jgi:hypothetical protein
LYLRLLLNIGGGRDKGGKRSKGAGKISWENGRLGKRERIGGEGKKMEGEKERGGEGIKKKEGPVWAPSSIPDLLSPKYALSCSTSHFIFKKRFPRK